MFSVLYHGYEVSFNGSATFNVYYAGKPVDSFTCYCDSRSEAFDAIMDWVDEFGAAYRRVM